jgi:hypothetical protein
MGRMFSKEFKKIEHIAERKVLDKKKYEVKSKK